MATRKKKGTPQKDVRRKKTKEEAVKRPLTKLERQLRVLDPSIPMALYLTLLNHEEVAYLREDDQSIHGFLVDLSSSPSVLYKILASAMYFESISLFCEMS